MSLAPVAGCSGDQGDQRVAGQHGASETSVLAVQVAERASPSTRAISPIRLPGPSTLSVTGPVRLACCDFHRDFAAQHQHHEAGVTRLALADQCGA